MADVNFAYRPRTPEMRARQSVAQRQRMGIPVGYVQVYGVHVPEARAEPLRGHAYEIARRWNAEAARQFVLKAAANDWQSEKPPFPIRLRKLGPALPPREFVRIQRQQRAFRTVARFARHWGRRQPIDWELVEELLLETANIGEVAGFLGVSESHVKNKLRQRHDHGLSVFGRRVRRV